MRGMEDQDAPVYTPLDVRTDSIEDHPESTGFPRWAKEMPYSDGPSRAV